MTLLQIVNGVLRRMREDVVTTYNETAYSTLIEDFVNEAKREVEDAWEWTKLRQTIQITTASGTFRYVLTGAGDRYRIKQVFNDTEDASLIRGTYKQMNRWLNQNSQTNGIPNYFDINGQSGGDPQVDLYPKPGGIYVLNFNMVIPQADLATAATELTVPDYPVLLLAHAKAISERGDDGSTQYAEVMGNAYKALGDAIAIDAANVPSEMVWYVA